jgi:uncharacterized protein
LLGVTRQLIGMDWLHARPFHYCGSIGPLVPSHHLNKSLDHIGQVLGGAGLRGLFGVDFILRDDDAWPVEVNPRYTASVEILEYASGLRALGHHAHACDPSVPRPDLPPAAFAASVGKAILFAPTQVIMPRHGPWTSALSADLNDMPTFADIPSAGQLISRGRPVLTLFASGESITDCEKNLRQKAVYVVQILFGR